uniref:Uncharacterized protein n=1 Tax=Anguilla anguilla TaxID=7936 RepID=A0A0E9SI40_ANGAN
MIELYFHIYKRKKMLW